jgi:F1F0 ATPase subunit 2
MNEFLTLIIAWLSGIALGAFFFIGLWFTIEKAVASTHPALWFVCSLLLRTGIVLIGFYYVYSLHCDRLFLCLIGFGMTGLLSTWLAQLGNQTKTTPLRGGSHAP